WPRRTAVRRGLPFRRAPGIEEIPPGDEQTVLLGLLEPRHDTAPDGFAEVALPPARQRALAVARARDAEVKIRLAVGRGYRRQVALIGFQIITGEAEHLAVIQRAVAAQLPRNRYDRTRCRRRR